MAAAIIYDTSDPRFPHATARGAQRGCGCDPCLDAQRRANKLSKLRAHRGIPQYAPEPMFDRACEKVARLLTEPGASCASISRAAGVSRSTIVRLRDRNGPVLRTRALAVLNAPETIAEHSNMVPGDKFLLMVGQLRALGYPMRWMDEQTGHGSGTTSTMFGSVRRGTYTCVSRSYYDDLRALADRIGDTPATPEVVGTNAAAVTATRRYAALDGYYPPVFYDEDGNVDHSSIPDHPITVANVAADDALTKALDYLRALDLGSTERAADHLCGTTDVRVRNMRLSSVTRALERFLEHHKLRVSDPGHAARRRHMTQVITDYSHGGVGSPVAVALALGLPDWSLDNTRTRGLLLPAERNRGRQLPRPTEPHPGVAEAAELTHLHPLTAVPLTTGKERAA